MHKMCLKLFVFLYVNMCMAMVNEPPVVDLPNGRIRGRKEETVHKNIFWAFEKIPYATPPLGTLRFKPPQPPPNWEGVLETTDLDVVCYQLGRPGPESEDCLYLNVFTSGVFLSIVRTSNIKLLPVVFYVHGGGYYDGSARKLGPDLFIDENIVYVTVNYRLGPFGFLSTKDNVIPGNMGLKDQLLALQWVHNNIHLFGGDPNQVTLVGHSAGAGSVSFLLLNPKVEGLIKGAIVQSGTALGVWTHQVRARESAFTFAKLINSTVEANYNNSQSLLTYLQKVPVHDLKKASNKMFAKIVGDSNYYTPERQGLYFSPVIEPENEGAFITDRIYKLFEEGKFTQVPLLIGFTSEECIEYYPELNQALVEMKKFDDHLDWLVPSGVEINNNYTKTEVGGLIRFMYTCGEPFANHLAENIKFCSDYLLNIPIMKQAELHSKFASTYFYVFTFDGKHGNVDIHYDGAGTVAHGEENKYLTCAGAKCDLSDYPESDQITQKRLIKIWSNFIKYQNPTPKPLELLQNITWPKLDTKERNFFYVDIGENLKIKNHPSKKYEKWANLYKIIGHNNFITY